MSQGRPSAESLAELKKRIESLESENSSLMDENQSKGETISKLETQVDVQDHLGSSLSPRQRDEVYKATKGPMHPFLVECLTNKFGERVVEIPNQTIEAVDESDAIRVFCATTEHPFSPERTLDVSSCRFRVTIQTDERDKRIAKRHKEVLDRRQKEAGLIMAGV